MFAKLYLEYIIICKNKHINIIGVFSDWDFLILGFSPVGLFSIGVFSIGLFSIGVFSVHQQQRGTTTDLFKWSLISTHKTL